MLELAGSSPDVMTSIEVHDMTPNPIHRLPHNYNSLKLGEGGAQRNVIRKYANNLQAGDQAAMSPCVIPPTMQ